MKMHFKAARSGNYRPAARGKTEIQYLIIHHAADGEAAAENAAYFARRNVSRSVHYFVDENEVWQSVRDQDIAWHCGTRGVYFHPYCRNENSIGIALCSHMRDGRYTFSPETALRTQRLLCILMKKYDIPPERVVRHYDVTHKTCPAPFVKSVTAWRTFKEELNEQTDDSREKER